MLATNSLIAPEGSSVIMMYSVEGGLTYQTQPLREQRRYLLQKDETIITYVMKKDSEPSPLHVRPIVEIEEEMTLMRNGLPLNDRDRTPNSPTVYKKTDGYDMAIKHELNCDPGEVAKIMNDLRVKPLIEERKKIEDAMASQQNTLRDLKAETEETPSKESQSVLIEGPSIITSSITGETISFMVDYPDFVFPMILKGAEDVCFRMLFPSKATKIEITINVKTKSVTALRRDILHQPHPHVSGFVCLGSFEGALFEAVKVKDYTQTINVLTDFMATFHRDNPFFTPRDVLWSKTDNEAERVAAKAILYQGEYRGYLTNSSSYCDFIRNKTGVSLSNDITQLPKSLVDKIEQYIEELKEIPVPAWITAKTGLSKIFDYRIVDLDFADSTGEICTSASCLKENSFNPALFNKIT